MAMKTGPKPRPLSERFEEKVDRSGGLHACHIWIGARGWNGYGRISRGGQHEGMVTASRAAWELAFGPIPDGLWVLHHCDNPPCVNVEHLYLGTHRENMADVKARGRGRNHNSGKTVCKNGHPLDDANTYRYGGERHCRACNNEAGKRYRERRTVRMMREQGGVCPAWC